MVDGVAHQVVAEPELGVEIDEQTGLDGLADRPGHLRRPLSEEVAQLGDREPGADDRRHPHQLGARTVEGREPAADRAPQRLRRLRSPPGLDRSLLDNQRILGSETGEQLGQDQGIAPRSGRHRLEPEAGPSAELGPEQLGDHRVVEGAEPEPIGALVDEPLDQVGHLGIAGWAAGDDQGEASIGGQGGHMAQQGQRLDITPVDVLDHDQEGQAGPLLHQGQHGIPGLGPGRGGGPAEVTRGGWPVEDAGQLAGSPLGPGAEVEHGPEEVEGVSPLVLLGPTHQAGDPEAALHLGHQHRLADPGLALDDGNTAGPLIDGEGGQEAGHLVAPADERQTAATHLPTLPRGPNPIRARRPPAQLSSRTSSVSWSVGGSPAWVSSLNESGSSWPVLW